MAATALPAMANQPSLMLTPASGNYTVGKTITMNIMVNSPGIAYDSVRADVTYPADMLQVKSVVLSPSFSVAAPGNYFDNAAGTLSYGGGIPSGSTQSAVFATMVFTVKKGGSALVALSGESVILREGAILASGGSGASFALAAPAAQPAPTPAQKPAPATVKATPPPKTQTPAATAEQEETNPAAASLASAIPVVESSNAKTSKQPWDFGRLALMLAIETIVLAIILWWAGKFLLGYHRKKA